MIDLNETEQALVNVVRHLLGTGEMQEIAEIFAKSQQELEHSTKWEVRFDAEVDGAPEDDGWVPFAADSDAYIYRRRPAPEEETNA